MDTSFRVPVEIEQIHVSDQFVLNSFAGIDFFQVAKRILQCDTTSRHVLIESIAGVPQGRQAGWIISFIYLSFSSSGALAPGGAPIPVPVMYPSKPKAAR